MTLHDVLQVLASHRTDEIVITTMSAVGAWPAISDGPLDFAYLPSSMGQGVPLGLGLAMASGRSVIVVCGDGSLLMNLGCLVTMSAHPAPLKVLLIDNGLYEVTGGQSVANAGKTDYATLARSVGLDRVFTARTIDEWRGCIGEVLSAEGPTFVWLTVEGRYGQATPSAPRPMAEQIARLTQAITPVSDREQESSTKKQ